MAGALALGTLSGAALPTAQAAEITGITPTITVVTSEVDYWSAFSVDIAFDVPPTARGGDTFTLRLADELRMMGTPVDLRTSTGALVATATADGPVLTYTFTDFVNTHANVRTRLNFWVELERSRVARGETVSVDVLVNQVRFDGPDVTTEPDPGTAPELNSIDKWMVWDDVTTQDRLMWGIELRPRTEDVTTVTITDTPGAGANLLCPAEGGYVRLAVGPDRRAFTEANLVEPTSVVCTDDRLTVTLTGSPAVRAGNYIEVGGLLEVDTPGANSYTNAAHVAVNALPALEDEVTVLRYGSSGQAEGDAVVSVGDLVWLDEDRDGRQGADEPGIEGVTLVLTGPDGGPVTDVYGEVVAPAVTDADGGYTFEGLPPLDAGERYTVTIDEDASADALEGLTPTTDGVGDREGDSSTGSASSEGLTTDGDRDPSLDFGFVRDAPTEPGAGPLPDFEPGPEPGPGTPGQPGGPGGPGGPGQPGPTVPTVPITPDDEGRLPLQPGQRPSVPDRTGVLPGAPAAPGGRVAPGTRLVAGTPGTRTTVAKTARPALARTGGELGALAGVAALLTGSGGALALRARRGRD